MEKYPVQIEGIICWLPPHKPERPRFPSNTPFLAITRFTSDLCADVLEAIIYYSPHRESMEDCYKVRLHFVSLDGKWEEIKRLSKNSEILIMDAYKVIAVCRNITLPVSPGTLLDNEW